ncbi:threonine synthase [Myxococcota bacterium]|nr:threonine synthase [Myxococcota bacterium]
MDGFHWRCSECGSVRSRDEGQSPCPDCLRGWEPGRPIRGILLGEFPWEEIRSRLDPRAPDLDLLRADEPAWRPPYPMPETPLFPAPRLARELDLPGLLVKHDGLLMSGSLKDRASCAVVSEALRIGQTTVVAASTGNAGSSLAAVCAAAGLKAVLYLPASAPKAKLLQARIHGAELHPVDGTYDDAFRLSLEHTRTRGGLNRNTAWHPMTIEGKKTVALEIFRQMGWRIPDWVVVPTGDGVILSGVYKGFLDLVRVGLARRLPRILAVQARASDAVHRHFRTGSYSDADSPATVADSISVRTPAAAFLAVRALRESAGESVVVSDEEILDAQAWLARSAGVFGEPASAAGLAGLRTFRNRLRGDERVVLLVTGHGLKDVEAPLGWMDRAGGTGGRMDGWR